MLATTIGSVITVTIIIVIGLFYVVHKSLLGKLISLLVDGVILLIAFGAIWFYTNYMYNNAERLFNRALSHYSETTVETAKSIYAKNKNIKYNVENNDFEILLGDNWYLLNDLLYKEEGDKVYLATSNQEYEVTDKQMKELLKGVLK